MDPSSQLQSKTAVSPQGGYEFLSPEERVSVGRNTYDSLALSEPQLPSNDAFPSDEAPHVGEYDMVDRPVGEYEGLSSATRIPAVHKVYKCMLHFTRYIRLVITVHKEASRNKERVFFAGRVHALE